MCKLHAFMISFFWQKNLSASHFLLNASELSHNGLRNRISIESFLINFVILLFFYWNPMIACKFRYALLWIKVFRVCQIPIDCCCLYMVNIDQCIVWIYLYCFDWSLCVCVYMFVTIIFTQFWSFYLIFVLFFLFGGGHL